MKRVVLICLLSILYFATNAQVFGGHGSTWWINYVNVGGAGRLKYYDIEDTLVNNTQYKRAKLSQYFFQNPNQYYNSSYSAPFKVVGDIVYLLVDGIDYPQYIFSADSGDSWICGPEDYYYCNCNSTLTTPYVKIESKFDTLINGQTLRAMRLRKYTCTANVYTSLVIEKMGSRNNHLFPLWWADTDSCSLGFFDDDTYYLSCFSSDEFPISQQSSETCDGPLEVNEELFQTLDIYPNPTESAINLSGLKNGSYSYALYNSCGQQVQSGILNTNTIDVADKPTGLYLLNVHTPAYSKSFKVLKH